MSYLDCNTRINLNSLKIKTKKHSTTMYNNNNTAIRKRFFSTQTILHNKSKLYNTNKKNWQNIVNNKLVVFIKNIKIQYKDSVIHSLVDKINGVKNPINEQDLKNQKNLNNVQKQIEKNMLTNSKKKELHNLKFKFKFDRFDTNLKEILIQNTINCLYYQNISNKLFKEDKIHLYLNPYFQNLYDKIILSSELKKEYILTKKKKK